jgi:hypothetical protein
MEITPLDVESPNASPSIRRTFFPSIYATHGSTPTTPAEETGYRKRLLDPGAGLPIDWKGMAFTLLDDLTSAHQAEGPIDVASSQQRQSPDNSIVGNGLADGESPLSLATSPPSTPSLATPSLDSPTLAFSVRGAVMDASGTRRMMLRRKSSSYLRVSASQQSGLDDHT